jgi:hypothetical protein
MVWMITIPELVAQALSSFLDVETRGNQEAAQRGFRRVTIRSSIGMPRSHPIRYSRAGRANSSDAVNSPARLSTRNTRKRAGGIYRPGPFAHIAAEPLMHRARHRPSTLSALRGFKPAPPPTADGLKA